MILFRKIIFVNFIVKLFLLVLDFKLFIIEGLIYKGGIKSRVRIKLEGFLVFGFIRRRGIFLVGIRLNKLRIIKGFKFFYGMRESNGDIC